MIANAPWSEFDTLMFALLVGLFVYILRREPYSPIPIGGLAGIGAGFLLNTIITISFEGMVWLAHPMFLIRSRELMVIGSILGLVGGICIRLAKRREPARNPDTEAPAQPEKS